MLNSRSSVHVRHIARTRILTERALWVKTLVKTLTSRIEVNRCPRLCSQYVLQSLPATIRMSTVTYAGASGMTWSNLPPECSSASSSGPVTVRWAAAWWRWSSPWQRTGAPSSPSSSHSERRLQCQLARGGPAPGRKEKMRSLGDWGTWVFLQCLQHVVPGRSAGGALLLPPSWAELPLQPAGYMGR